MLKFRRTTSFIFLRYLEKTTWINQATPPKHQNHFSTTGCDRNLGLPPPEKLTFRGWLYYQLLPHTAYMSLWWQLSHYKYIYIYCILYIYMYVYIILSVFAFHDCLHCHWWLPFLFTSIPRNCLGLPSTDADPTMIQCCYGVRSVWSTVCPTRGGVTTIKIHTWPKFGLLVTSYHGRSSSKNEKRCWRKHTWCSTNKVN